MIAFRVQWEIDIEADDAEEAAVLALENQREAESIATVFEVRAEGVVPRRFDLGEIS
jgi:hypothetical protein